MKKVTGWLMVGTLLAYLLSVAISSSLIFFAAVFAWLIFVLMWNDLGKSSRNQAIILIGGGVLALAYAAGNGVFLSFAEVLSTNVPMLAMFAAVSFLALTTAETEEQTLPRGNLAIVTTALGTNLLGAVINLSVIFVFGDRMKRHGTLSRSQSKLLGRSFCAAAWWSPFFIATGVALTYAPAMQWHRTIGPGILMTILAIAYSTIETALAKRQEFKGYPLKVESLIVPFTLAVAVLTLHFFFDDINTITLICLVAPLGAFLFMTGRPRRTTLGDFIANRAYSVSSQFVLFLAAGVFSSGLKAITLVYPTVFNLEGMYFTPALFAVISGILILAGIIGVHPVVGIAVVSPLLLPLAPDPSQLGFLFLTSWAISTGSSPLSGVGLVLTSRYQVSPKHILQNNYHYAVVMWLLACGMNMLFWG
ncbi:MAG: hypothetical protein ACK5PS_05795 [Desulfopila sp.]